MITYTQWISANCSFIRNVHQLLVQLKKKTFVSVHMMYQNSSLVFHSVNQMNIAQQRLFAFVGNNSNKNKREKNVSWRVKNSNRQKNQKTKSIFSLAANYGFHSFIYATTKPARGQRCLGGLNNSELERKPLSINNLRCWSWEMLEADKPIMEQTYRKTNYAFFSQMISSPIFRLFPY